MWEAVAFAALGLGIAYAATHFMPDRFPSRSLVLATGPVAALVGGLITRTVLGGGHLAVTLPAAALVAAALLSLLIRPADDRRFLHHSVAGRA
ncbi:hypothetical protein QMK19_28335 [Streptomyces sp. H10-C2]|uniref:hypothetical protein n=1 Tax=unclassified Streptomyces TaxID=2593676 RepID=UPI0024B8EFF6|nr:MULTISPECIES: hypothetical protein [unclassified Streptomyces]MDJ0343867.1 hypothetical protein [Streptomyces sp. PH10-H1]MDJ0373456.1 hypothetical protein [Streptomyces sp. H10-C2]